MYIKYYEVEHFKKEMKRMIVYSPSREVDFIDETFL